MSDCKQCEEKRKKQQQEIDHLKSVKSNQDNLLKKNTELSAKLLALDNTMTNFKKATDEKLGAIIKQYDNSFESVLNYLSNNNIVDKSSIHYQKIMRLAPMKIQ